MRGNVVCLPKSGSSYVADLLGGAAVHEYDHARISMLALERDPVAQAALAAYYLHARGEELLGRIDVCTSKIFLLSCLNECECALPTVFLFRDPLHWCRSILSYSISVARSGGYQDWVSQFQALFCGDYPLTLSDLSCERSLVKHISALLPGLVGLWFRSYSSVLSRLPFFRQPLLLVTSSLSNSNSEILAHFSVADLPSGFRSSKKVNPSMPFSLIADECRAYFHGYSPLPARVTAQSMNEYLRAFADWCESPLLEA